MYRHLFTIIAFNYIAACAPAVPVIGDGFVENTANENTAKLLAQSLTDAIEQGDYAEWQWYYRSHSGTARFEYQDDSWVGRVAGDLSFVLSPERIHVLDVTLEGFGDSSEDFSGALDITVRLPASRDAGTIALDGTLDSSIGGVVDIDLEVEVEHGSGYRAIEWSGTVDDEVVAGHVEEKEDIDEGQGGGCKAPIGVDCE